ncbi:MAG TPA: hypothetical protein VMR29_06705, partial [Candidatus Binatia bacterium]|nr:hypothetical protein [Candidatus Binatia bacterium]
TATAHDDPPALRLPCDPLDNALCLLPFPNDRFTKPDAHTASGRRIDFQLLEMPRTFGVLPIDPTEWNRNDGFSPGSMMLTFVPGLDLHQTWGTEALTGPRVGGPNDPRDHVADIGRYAAPGAPMLLIDAASGERWPFWSELDENASTPANQRLLILRAATNLREGHRYLVALRALKDAQGNVIPAGAQFAAYRDNKPGPAGDLTFEETRRAEVNRIIAEIESAETARGNPFDRSALYLAWEFTVASERNLTERMLAIRDDAFAQLGDVDLADSVIQGVAPRFAITTVTDEPDDPRTLRQVEGTITVPNYLDLPPQPLVDSLQSPVDTPAGNSLPGQAIPFARFFYGPDGLPRQNPLVPTIDVPFVCSIPRAASADAPAHPTLYGHGLLGSRFESTGGSTDRDRERNFMPCAVNWMGFAEYDVLNAVITLLDPSNMPSMIDRAQQGFLDFLYLGRALAHGGGLATNAAFQTTDGKPLFQTGELFYDGNSQGGIMGGALTALSVDLTRSTLGVTGMNYSTLLNRSSDWEGPLFDPANPGIPSYSSLLYTAFPNKQEQQLMFALLQMLWDRGEADGYAAHMTSDPLPNTPAHQVLMHAAFGDFQVTNFAAEVEARTIGARVMDTALMPGRHWAIQPYFGLQPFPRDTSGNLLPWNGSAFVYWDSGNLPPPNANVPPLPDGGDPHEDPRRDPRGADQKEHFYLTGEIIDVMSGGPYLLCRPGAESQIPRVPSQFASDWCQ